ncbi:MAG: DNA mismatch repair endonuclease MutL [Candidatus Aegiribacteria sp.]|nr:DNA mismatch repair endonuclease MutL [Candidatus Aegiribacteria sp.]
MPHIRVLSDTVINMISAGEVVERPASVVKELIENALDAEATEITVELEQGGRKSIIVRDNGLGMNRHDLLLSVQRHATSKISSSSDLSSLSTLGFRGEALPSIAAVTHFTILTSDGDEGFRMRMDGGILRDVSAAARTRGTTVTAGGLFYNQPARRSFLRTQATELSWVEKFITGSALAREEIAFRLLHNGNELFHLPAGQSVPERLRSRYGLPGDSRYVKSEGQSGRTSVKLIWFPDSRWNRRSHQYFLVNGRMVYTGLISGPVDAVLAGPAGYPLLYCSVSVPPDEVDVNVHPQKREVRFKKPSSIREAVEAALGELPSSRKSGMTMLTGRRDPIGSFANDTNKNIYTEDLFNASMQVQAPGAVGASGRTEQDFPIVQIGRSYLVTSTDKGIVLIDQHAAHERILFETVLKSMNSDSGSGHQKLLLPENIRLDASEREQMDDYRAVLNKSGFEFHIDGETLVLTAVPPGTFHGISALREILRSLQNPENKDMPVREKVAAAAACAGAVKFGDPLSSLETRHLIDQLFSTSDPFHCPHGRPTLIEISFEELGEKFGR